MRISVLLTAVLTALALVACGKSPEPAVQSPSPVAAAPHQQYLDKAATQMENKEFSEAAISAGIARDMAENAGDGTAVIDSRLLLAKAWLKSGESMKAAGEYAELSAVKELPQSEQVAQAVAELEKQGLEWLKSAEQKKGEEARTLVTDANKLFDLLKLDARRVEGRKALAGLMLKAEDFQGAKLVLEEARKLAPEDKEIAALLKQTSPPPPPPPAAAQAQSPAAGPNRAMSSEELFKAPSWLKGCWFLHSLSLSGTNGGCFLYFRQEGDVMWGAIVETQILTSVRTDGMGRAISRGIPFHPALYQHNLKGKIDGKNFFFTVPGAGISGYMQIKGKDITGKMKFKKKGITKEFKGYRMDKPMEIDVKGKGTLVIPVGG